MDKRKRTGTEVQLGKKVKVTHVDYFNMTSAADSTDPWFDCLVWGYTERGNCESNPHLKMLILKCLGVT